MTTFRFEFKPVDAADRSLVHNWLTQPHAAEWFYGQGLANTLQHLDAFLAGASASRYWLAYEQNRPFAFLITSSVQKPNDELAHWCSAKGKAITLDMLIGNAFDLGKGLSLPLVQEFLAREFPDVDEVLIDPEATNARAIRAYQKIGFVILSEFIPAHNPHLHYMMRLDRKKTRSHPT